MVQRSPSLHAIPSTGKAGPQVPVTTSHVSAPLHGLPSSQSASALQQPGTPIAHVWARVGDGRPVSARAVRAMARRTASTGGDYTRPTLRVSLTSLALAALAATAGVPARAHADVPSLAGASPPARKVR